MPWYFFAIERREPPERCERECISFRNRGGPRGANPAAENWFPLLVAVSRGGFANTPWLQLPWRRRRDSPAHLVQ